MFGEIELETYSVELILDDFLVRGRIQPRGEVLIYLNDRNWDFLPVRHCELLPLNKENRVGTVSREFLVINKKHLFGLSFVEQNEVEKIRIPQSNRPLVCYINQFAIQGKVHVPADAPAEDLLDEMHDYYALSEASIFPLQPLSVSPTLKVPLMMISRGRVQVYNVPAA